MKKKDFIAQDLLSKIYQHAASLPGKQMPEKLPPERTLAEEYGVSRFTIRKALEKLASIGAVRLVQGAGNYINPDIRNNPLVYNSVTEKKFNQITFRLLSLHKRLPTRDEQQMFGISDAVFLWEFCRLRCVDNQKVQIEVSRMPADLFVDMTRRVPEQSIQKYVLGKGYEISHFLTHYQAVTINQVQAQLLECKKGIAAMHIINRGMLKDGRVYEVSDIIDINYSCTYVIPFNQDNLTFRQSP
ncbi:GntR family transcriptional regulator [Dickeya dianthicola]|uniref:GntR family transcriptional regulator n=1 Tax=Dickeya dianthicola TaxID=204039 RepID=UPI00136985EE|nr:GntR family transcriptional regulator [Dickeya dianthicola]MCI4238489.1 GntR family transcriptional regulator [Dickeya dianthicola]MCI4256379.1 GntR family transcriptional regulator [Dickeya dianthicola]MZG20614.1 GntR family transcriptional regulator [Dickeya dianthicola]MZI88709.1 GntR family transcriptional regulator [Dickeya dianthicola]